MKRTLLLFLTAALLSALVGCQRPHENEPPLVNVETTEQATETEKTPPKDTEAQTEAVTEPTERQAEREALSAVSLEIKERSEP